MLAAHVKNADGEYITKEEPGAASIEEDSVRSVDEGVITISLSDWGSLALKRYGLDTCRWGNAIRLRG